MASGSAGDEVTELTRAQVAPHNSRNDCWVIIHDKVYDISKFLPEHPGGDEVVLEQAGQDGTAAFEDIGHSLDARQIMDEHFVGDIVKSERRDEQKFSTSGIMTLVGWIVPVVFGFGFYYVYQNYVK